jgi:hypothetical protein
LQLNRSGQHWGYSLCYHVRALLHSALHGCLHGALQSFHPLTIQRIIRSGLSLQTRRSLCQDGI